MAKVILAKKSRVLICVQILLYVGAINLSDLITLKIIRSFTGH